MKLEQLHISISEAAEQLNVSHATIRNWIRIGIITPIQTRPINLDRDEIRVLNEKIKSNQFSRLQKGANKSRNRQVVRTVGNPQLANLQAKLQPYLKHKKELEAALYLLTQPFLSPEKHQKAWGEQPVISDKIRECVSEFSFNDKSPEFLGVIYQALSLGGDRSQKGAFYTPFSLVNDIVTNLDKQPEKVLDPCCGAGYFLIAVARKFNLSPENIYGFDIDPIAVKLTKIALMLHYDQQDFEPNIFLVDTLSRATNPFKESFDLVIGNPPWGGKSTKSSFKELNSKENFSKFIVKSESLLTPHGSICFILPESFLNVKRHHDIRAYLLEHLNIAKIRLLGRPFSNVYTSAILLTLIKESPKQEILIEDLEANKRLILIEDILQNDLTINPEQSHHDVELIDKICAIPHTTLKNQAQWALGVVTGNNKEFIKSEPATGLTPVYRGADILPFGFKSPSGYIDFEPEKMQQIAPLERYFADEKIVYRFIADRPICAVDSDKRLTLNSANIVIPQIENWSLHEIAAYLNSPVLHFYFIKRYQTKKILRNHLESLPLPIKPHKLVAELAKNGSVEWRGNRPMNKLIAESYNLTQEEYDYIIAELKTPPKV